MILPPLPAGLVATRRDLQRVATHIVARRRHDRSGRLGLRASPGGLAAPATGGRDPEVLRTDGDLLVVERGAASSVTRMTTLADLARAAGVDLAAPFDAGPDAPVVGDASAPLSVDPVAARALGDWWWAASTAIDEVVAGLGPDGAPSTVQLWPEHFDVACDVAWGPGERDRANLGGSAGDDAHPEPYLYLGPWGPGRPGGPGYWNAPFGAVLGHARLRRSGDPRGTALAFLRRGLELLATG